uniref:ADP-ribosyl cyclase/cyclic ADP-ribose hydrolase n=1 Tax=Globodera pallida TaxID=36090 RepID=A0A183C315_GLOPA
MFSESASTPLSASVADRVSMYSSKSVSVLPHHISLGSISLGSSFASSGGGSCCSFSTAATVVKGRENVVESSFMLPRQDVDVGEMQRKAGDAAGWGQPSRLEQAEEDDRDRLAPLKSAADGRHCFSPGSRSPLPVNASQPRPSVDIANGFYRTTTVVANGSGLLSLGSGTLFGAEQKSRSMGNLDRSGTAPQSNGVDGRTVPSSSHQRSFSPSSSSGERANAVPGLQRQHWKYGSLRNCAFVSSASGIVLPQLRHQFSTTVPPQDESGGEQPIRGPNGLIIEHLPKDVAKVDANGQQHNGESGGKRMPKPKEIATEESRNSDIRLQQSLSTPGGANDSASTLLNGSGSFGGMRKESEYRRYRSEGSTSGPTVSLAPHQPAEIPDVTMLDDLSPTIVVGGERHCSSPPNRLNLFQQDTIVGNGTPLSKHSSEQVMMMHTLKTKLQKYQTFIDKAFQLIQQGIDEQIFEGCTIVTKVMTKAWLFPKISHDLAYALCDYLRDQSYFETLVVLFIKPGINESVRLCCGRVLEECMANSNCELIIQKGYLKKVVATAEKLNKNQEQQRLSLSIMESLFKHSPETTNKLIDFQVIDHILLTCKRATDTPNTLRHAALALANLSLCSCSEAKKKLILKKLPDWLFLLASQPDDITRYYACLAICVLGSASTNSKEMEMAVSKSGTLTLVEPFLTTHQPSTFSQHDYKHSQGRPKEWLLRLLPLLSSKCREAKSMAAFHLCIEATIKKDQQKLEILAEIGAIQALKECASSPDELPAKFASEALTIIGEQVPYKLSQQVPCWSIKDVQYWVEKIGFGTFSAAFAAHMVDGDLLLLLTEKELEEDLGMSSGLLRKRFMRELESLKIAADYSSVDETHLDQFLMSLSSDLSVYTYQMLGMGLNRNLLPQLTNDMVSLERRTANTLMTSKWLFSASKLMCSSATDVLLQLRGYKVFIDVDRLYAGKFDSHLLKNIQAAKHFILVLTPHSLDRLLNDNNCEDWIHKELHCAFEHQKNVIPIFDQLFEFPELESQLPDDIRQITRFNGVRWVHDYQEACIDKVERFIKGELNRVPSLGANSLAIPASTPAVAPCSTSAGRKGTAYRLNGTSVPSATGHATPTAGNARTTPTMGNSGARLQRQSQNTQMDNTMTNSSNGAVRSSSIEKQRRKPLFSSVSTVNSER